MSRRKGRLPVGLCGLLLMAVGASGVFAEPPIRGTLPPGRVCEPRPDRKACAKIICPDRAEQCRPTRVRCSASGICTVEECDCVRPNQCHVNMPGPGNPQGPHCQGGCPDGEVCNEIRTMLSDGGYELSCECGPEECEPARNGRECSDVVCPDPNDVCTPTRVICNPGGVCRVAECDCSDPERCHPELTPRGTVPGVECVGACPPGQVCEERRTPLANGFSEVKCECVPEPVCEPNPQGTDCTDFVCPDGVSMCRPTQVVCNPTTGECRVVSCDCVEDRCHVELTAAAGPVCVGACPPGEICVRDVQMVGGLQVITCRCEPEPQVCEPNTTGTGCNDVVCPDPAQRCVPTQLLCGPNGCRVVACDCQDVDRCHPEPNPAGTTPPADCVGACPPGEQCVRVVTETPAGLLFECDCEPIPQVCEPDSTGTHCNDVVCPLPNEKCIPTAVAVDVNGNVRVVSCDCRSQDECHVVPSPLDIFPPQFDCAGGCPPGFVCNEFTVTFDNGTVLTRCDCIPAPQCEPTPDGFSCTDTLCPNNTEKCKPTAVECDAAGICRVVACDCVDGARCHMELTNAAGPVCVGDCPPGMECERTATTNPATGVTTIRCDCVPVQPVCEPRDDGFGCTDVVCPDATEKCVPKVVACGPNGDCKVEVCDCDDPNLCHVEMTTAAGPICVGACPDGTECERTVTTDPATGVTLIRCDCVPVAVCEPNPASPTGCNPVQCPLPNERCLPTEVICVPGAPCQAVNCDCQPFDRCHAVVTPTGVFCDGTCPDGTECERTVTTDPATGATHIKCDCVPVQVKCEPLPDGSRCTDFKCEDDTQLCVPKVVECIPGTTICKVIACDCDGADRCHVEVTAAAGPVCVGACPDGTECERITTTTADGTIQIRCDCVPVEPVCEPNPASPTGCNPVQCPLPNERCLPTEVICVPGAPCEAVDCDCQPFDRCHAVVTPNGVFCDGTCPDGTECERTVTTDPATGATHIKCDCVPVQVQCEPLPDGSRCTDFKCEDDTQLCVPKVIECIPGTTICKVIACDCDGADRCHVEMTATAGPICVGDCPTGFVCERFSVPTDNGTIVTRCDCVPVQPVCEPRDDGFGCTDVVCPDPTEKCVPKVVACGPDGVCKVVVCDCDDSNRCHVEMTTAGGPVCVGACPDGTECERTVTTDPATGVTHVRCDCVPVEPPCEPNPASPTGCNPVVCPDPHQVCLPTKIVCSANNVCKVVSCDCRDKDRCHIAPPASGVPTTCIGACPDGEVCVQHVTQLTPGACSLPPDPGPCDAAIPRWYYDPANEQCEMFVYGGCGGNPNNFATKEECEASCPFGGIAITCDCDPVEPVCEPDPTRTHCNDVVCPLPDEKCIPTAMAVDVDGNVFVAACDCRRSDECHVVPSTIVDAFPPQFDCEGGCPPGMECVEFTVTFDNGTTLTRCDCQPVQPVCEPRDDGFGCTDVVCPDPTEKCVPKVIACGPNGDCKVEVCDCDKSDLCHVEFTTAGPACVGGCPDGFECEKFEVINSATGVTYIRCDCVPVQVKCEPLPDGSRCTDFKCEDDTQLCVPKVIECIPGTTICKVIACDCDGANRCHVEMTATGAPFCVGDCPDGTECERFTTTTADGTIQIRCDCVPVPQCQPTPDGFSCTDTLCPNNTEKCKPTAVECDAAGICRVVACDCVDGARCHMELTNAAGPVCVGDCPDGTECERTVTTDPATGVTLIRCDCVPVAVCEPNPEGTACNDVVCPDGVSKCKPTLVQCDPLTNECHVVKCDCLDGDRCHMELTASAGPVCVGTCPDGTECERTVTTDPATGVITIHCDCVPVQVQCEPLPDGSRCTDFKCEDDTQLCVPKVIECIPGTTICKVIACDCTGADVCHPELSTIVGGAPVACVGACPDGFECERTLISTGTVIHVRCDCVPVQQCEPSATTVTGCSLVECPLPNQRCLPTEVHCVPGAPCEAVDCECQDVDRCHVELANGAVPFCAGGCPTGEECRHYNVTQADGTVLFGCDCVPVEPVCEPNSAGTGCNDVVCPDPAEKCVPRSIVCDATGCRVNACDCGDPNSCHPELDPTNNGEPGTCVGACPDGTVCTPRTTTQADGTVLFTCDCVPVQPICEPSATTPTGCSLVTCPLPNERCLPRRAVCGPNGCVVVECDCQPFDRCHVVATPNGAFCEGVCPPGEVCRRTETTTTAGLVEVTCDCVPVAQECEPDDTSPTGCSDFVCPDPTERCIPVVIGVSPNGVVRVLECDCRNEDECHLVRSDADIFPPQFDCVGTCPPGEQCETFRTVSTTGEIITACDCVPVTATCEPDATGLRCEDVVCPLAVEKCTPTRLLCNIDGGNCQVLACDCGNPEGCHPEVDPASLEPLCVGVCPAGQVCEQTAEKTPTGEALIVECRCITPEPTCEPDPTGLACQNVGCPNSLQRCTPIRVECDLTGLNCRVVECDCREPQFCHPVIQPAGATPPVICQGVCPIDTECTAVVQGDPAVGVMSVRCECRIQPPPPGLRP